MGKTGDILRGKLLARVIKARRQFGAIPLRMVGELPVILLVTTRQRQRWVVPKGWPMNGMTPWDAAAKEAWEEAGVHGRIERERVGHYSYRKRLPNGSGPELSVDLFLLHVEREMAAWPEQHQRERRWVALSEAAGLVEEPGLALALRDLVPRLCPPSPPTAAADGDSPL